MRGGDARDGGERLAVGGGEDDVLGPQPEVDVHDGAAGGDGRGARGEDVDDDAGTHGRADGHRGHVHALGCDKVLDEAALAGVVGDVLDAPEDLAVWRAGMSAVMSVQVAEGPERMGAPLGSRARIH